MERATEIVKTFDDISLPYNSLITRGDSKLKQQIWDFLNGNSYNTYCKLRATVGVSRYTYRDWVLYINENEKNRSVVRLLQECYEETNMLRSNYRYNELTFSNLTWSKFTSIFNRNSKLSGSIEEDREKYYNEINSKYIKTIMVIWKKVYSCAIELLQAYDMLDEFYIDNPSIERIFNTGTLISSGESKDVYALHELLYKCLNSKECRDKLIKIESERTKKVLEKKRQKYEREFECINLFNCIEKNKMKNIEIYIEYCEINKLKRNSTDFLNYFTQTKTTKLLELLHNIDGQNEISTAVEIVNIPEAQVLDEGAELFK